MSTQHTPAPWTVLNGDWDDAGNARYTLKGTTTVGYANARLIAAAPDLLEALQRIRHWAEADKVNYTGDHPVAIARAAIAKALGEKT